MREALVDGSFYAIFLDIYLPDGNGIELIPEIQRIQPDVPIIMITGDGRIETVVEAMQAGGVGLLFETARIAPFEGHRQERP